MSRARDACSMAPLVEASFDGRLGASDVASVERHLAQCADCSALVRELERLRDLALSPLAPVPPLERRRARVRLMRDAAMGVTPKRTSRAPVLALVAAALAALGSWVAWSSARSGPTLLVARSAMAAVPPHAKLTLLGTNAETRRTTVGETEIVELSRGAIQLWVRPLAPAQRLWVRTSDAEIEVRGTIFRVDAEDGRLAHVEVLEGTVEVRRGEERTVLAIGERWSATRGASGELAEKAPPNAPAPPPLPSTLAPRPRDAHATPASSARAVPSATPSASAVASASPAASSAAGPPKTTFGGAVALVDRGEYGAAVEQLSAFAETHPDDPRREDARFLVIVALERAGRFDAAVVAARKYLADFPTGARRSEASAVITAYGARDGG